MAQDKKIITADLLERFKTKQDAQNASTYLARIVYPTLPTELNYVGRIAFQVSDERLYVYTSNGWKKLPWFDEYTAPWTTDGNGDISPNV